MALAHVSAVYRVEEGKMNTNMDNLKPSPHLCCPLFIPLFLCGNVQQDNRKARVQNGSLSSEHRLSDS